VTSNAGATRAPLSILVVLPSVPLRLLAAAAFRDVLAHTGRDVRMVEAGTALDALWLLARARPSLALVALDLPVLSGDELVALLRARPEHRGLPILAVAPASDGEAQRRAAAAGVAALLRTPFELDAVAAALAAAGIPGDGA
jgi:two-component system, chemotaxis family, chemotaxis protein CheY